jgi:hypothetical protein
MPHQNQHYVSQVLLRRFSDKGFLQRFSVKTNTWKRVSPRRVFSGLGYTQLMAYGEMDTSLEESFGKIENALPKTLHALDDAATRVRTEIPADIWDNLIWYCAYLWRISPFAKAVAPIEFVYQLNMDLGQGRTDLLALLGITESDIQRIKSLYANGARFIIQGNNYLQLVYRIQFVRKCKEDYMRLRHFTNWVLYNSPVELPLSDVAFCEFVENASQKHWHVLPLAPRLVLVGTRKIGVELRPSSGAVLRSETLTSGQAEYFLDAICLSAFTALAFHSKVDDVPMLRRRAIERGLTFAKIKNLDEVLKACTRPFNGPFLIQPATKGEYAAFMKSSVEN